jgi:hypothetical protein
LVPAVAVVASDALGAGKERALRLVQRVERLHQLLEQDDERGEVLRPGGEPKSARRDGNG